MPAWFLNPALTRFRAAVDAAWPNRDRASDGTIADALHPATSDHQPDADGSVDAWDMDVDGVPVEHLKAAFQAHEASLYWIHAGQIASRDWHWQRRPYDGANRHDKHVHWNTRTSQENSTAPWVIKEDGMDEKDFEALIWRVEALLTNRLAVAGGPTKGEVNQLAATLEELANRPPVASAPVDPAALKAALLDPEVLAVYARAINEDAAARMAG